MSTPRCGATRAWPRWPAHAPGAGSTTARCWSRATAASGSAPTAELPAGARRIDAEHDLGGALVTPGLIDCHTHLVYGGHRAREFELRLQGASYEEIARAGGGIRSTVAATRAAERRHAVRQRARARARADGRRRDDDRDQVRLRPDARATRRAACAWRAASARELPLTVRTTCLAAHALPPEFAGRADDYIDAVVQLAAAAGTPKGWSTRSTRSASASASRRRRRGACSTPRARCGCRSSCMPSS